MPRGNGGEAKDHYSKFKGTHNVERPFVEIETLYGDEKKFRTRCRQGWELVECHYQPASNKALDDGYAVFVIGRTAEARDAATAAREAERALKGKGKKTSAKKTTGKKKKTTRS